MYLIYLAALVHHTVFCDNKIHLIVYTDSTKDWVWIKYNGVDNKPVTAKEQKIFNITDDNLKRGVKIELGKEPDDIFLMDPTKYGNLYAKYNWTTVMRSLRVKSAEVVEAISNEVVVKSHERINNTTKTIKSDVGISEIVESAVFSVWSKDGLPDDEIYFDVDYNFHGGVVTYHNRWRRDNFHSASLPFGVMNNGYINIKPGQKVVSRLKGRQTILLLKIHYKASLVGSVVLNYAHTYGKYHFWAPKVDDVMKAAGLKNEIVTTELIEVRCYTNPKLEIFDSDNKEPLNVVMAPMPFMVKSKLKKVHHRKNKKRKN